MKYVRIQILWCRQYHSVKYHSYYTQNLTFSQARVQRITFTFWSNVLIPLCFTEASNEEIGWGMAHWLKHLLCRQENLHQAASFQHWGGAAAKPQPAAQSASFQASEPLSQNTKENWWCPRNDTKDFLWPSQGCALTCTHTYANTQQPIPPPRKHTTMTTLESHPHANTQQQLWNPTPTQTHNNNDFGIPPRLEYCHCHFSAVTVCPFTHL